MIRPLYCVNKVHEKFVDIDCYIERFNNIIANYKKNVHAQKKTKELLLSEPYLLRVNSTNKSGQSSISSGSKSPKTPPKNIDDSTNPISVKDYKFSDMIHTQ
jgi:hypothetical protein